MNLYDVLFLVTANWVNSVFLIGTILSIAHRKKPIVRSTFPLLSIPISIIYFALVVVNVFNEMTDKVPCFVYLWLPSMLVIVAGNIYLVKFWRLFVQTTCGKLGKQRYNMNMRMMPSIPNGLSNAIMFSVALDNCDLNAEDSCSDLSQMREPFEKGALWGRFEYWIFSHPSLGKTSFMVKMFITITILEMLLPLTLNLTTDQYLEPFQTCNERTLPEIESFFAVLTFYGVAFFTTMFIIRKCVEWNGLKRQTILTAFAWFFVLFVFVGIGIGKKVHGKREVWDRLFSFFSVICWLFPFASDVLWPLLRSHQNSKMHKTDRKTDVFDMEKLIRSKDHKEREYGWDLLISYMTEHMSAADEHENTFLLHSLFFLHEYIQKRDELMDLTNYKTNPGDYGLLDVELCGLVIVAWTKYLHEKGQYTWEEDIDAPFLLRFENLGELKKDLEKTIQEITATKKFPSLSRDEQSQAGKQLRKVYSEVLRKIEKRIIKDFRKSVQYDMYIEIAKKLNKQV